MTNPIQAAQFDIVPHPLLWQAAAEVLPCSSPPMCSNLSSSAPALPFQASRITVPAAQSHPPECSVWGCLQALCETRTSSGKDRVLHVIVCTAGLGCLMSEAFMADRLPVIPAI